MSLGFSLLPSLPLLSVRVKWLGPSYPLLAQREGWDPASCCLSQGKGGTQLLIACHKGKVGPSSCCLLKREEGGT